MKNEYMKYMKYQSIIEYESVGIRDEVVGVAGMNGPGGKRHE